MPMACTNGVGSSQKSSRVGSNRLNAAAFASLSIVDISPSSFLAPTALLKESGPARGDIKSFRLSSFMHASTLEMSMSLVAIDACLYLS